MATDIIARGMAATGINEASRANERIDQLPKGMNYVGAVNYYNDLPNNAEVGDVYTVKYTGTSGTDPDGREYVWGDDSGTNTWIQIGPDMSNYQEKLISGQNIKSINNTSLLGNGNLDVKDIFYCTHGITTFAQITQALSDGKLPVCIYNDDRYYIYCSSSSIVHRFSSMQSDYVRYLTVDNTDTWSNVQAYNLQLVSNKVTSISSDSTDTQYPSAKAVYDFVGNSKELFWCAYGTTTYSEITTALSNNKLPVCIYSNRFYKYDLKSPTDRYTFNAHYADTIYTISVPANNTWSAGSTQFEITSNKTTSISSASTNTQYPSAKCVYDYAQPILESGINIKTVHGNSLLGSGNIEIPTYSPFKATWRHDTIAHLMTDIAADSDVTVGSSYLGEVDNVTAAEGLFNGNAEIVINVMRSNLYWCIISSNNVDPYHWEATFSGATISAKGWTPYVPGTRTIAGIDLKDNITAAELQTALNPMTTSQDIIVGGNNGAPTRLAKGSNGNLLGVNASGNLAYTNSLPIITTEPTQANTNGLIIVVLSSEPATKYDGYLYLITK